MADAYYTVATITESGSMRSRVAACAAAEGVDVDPIQWAFDHRYNWAASPGWGAKWDSAVASGVPDPGADPSVISDGDILSAVQPLVSAG